MRVLPYGHVRLAQGTDSLRLLRAFAAGAMYYDPGIKLTGARLCLQDQPQQVEMQTAACDESGAS